MLNRCLHALLLCLLTGSGALCLQAQVSVDVMLKQEQFLRDETLPLAVRVTNRSGQELNLGRDHQWLSFSVSKLDGSLATRLSKVPVAGPFTLPSSQSVDRVVDLMPYFVLEPGRYRVTATVKIRDWNASFRSKPKTMEVVRGVKLWEQTVGIPQAENKEAPPELRRFVLLQARYLKNMFLYARVTGPTDNKVIRVFPLGPFVNFVPVDRRVDRKSQLHVLFQDGPRSFNYSVVDPNGRLVKRQRHDYFQSRPVLAADGAGRVLVKGGIRRLTPNDLPPSAVIPETNDVQVPAP